MGRTKDPNGGVRPAILAAALDLFADKGYDATSVQEIVVRAGVTKGALYHYFGSKDDILYEIYGTVFGREITALRAILGRGDDPATALRAIIEDLVTSTAQNTKATAVFARGAAADSANWRAMQDNWREYQELVRDVIRAGQADGAFRADASPEVVSWSVFGFTTTLHTWFRPDGPKSPADIGRELAVLVLAGLEPAPRA